MIETLAAAVGREHVLTDDESCVLFSQDVYTKALPAMAVVRPANTAELSDVVAAATRAGHAVIARGGGMSYTSGFVPREEGSIIVDTQRMNRVVEINARDMYVKVESGCTWNDLHEALAPRGLRTPYWGTLSGIHATVGGSVSQNSIFWGSARYGSVADSVIGLEVVLADGSIVTTGSASQTRARPFFRHYGPDLTGLFCCDTGALGLKATLTLRLVPAREHREQLSFDFAEHTGLIRAMSGIARAEIADECFAFDPNLQAVRLQRESLMSDFRKFAGVLKSAGSVVGAVKDGTRVALAGRGFMDDVDYSLHVMIEERSAEAAAASAAAARRIGVESGGTEIENSIPKILRANPFTPLNNMVGPNGERWVPVHALIPHSMAMQLYEDVRRLFDSHEALMDEHGIGFGFLLTVISTNCFVIEPVFFTPDSLNELHEATIEKKVLKKMAGFDANPAAAEATSRLRSELIELFCERGAVHLQIGKSYPYREGLRPESWRIVEAVKRSVDPRGRVNPGSLGLD